MTEITETAIESQADLMPKQNQMIEHGMKLMIEHGMELMIRKPYHREYRGDACVLPQKKRANGSLSFYVFTLFLTTSKRRSRVWPVAQRRSNNGFFLALRCVLLYCLGA
ncbi:hypothetical protein [Amphritea sp.]|uniref:hypothetical protein n=1 Tax=Amphritea sp. TaxID=1872502 RepID=UPI003D120877